MKPRSAEYEQMDEARKQHLAAGSSYGEATRGAIADVVRSQPSIHERTYYGPDSPWSFFRDLAVVAEQDNLQQKILERGDRRIEAVRTSTLPHPTHGGLEEARQRLATIEKRDVTSADPGGLSFLPGGSVPGFIADEFARAARAQGTLAAAFGTRPLPEAGKKIEAARIETGASTAVQSSEGGTVSETDYDSATNSSNIAYVAGQVDQSNQLWERAAPGYDSVLAAELGADLAAKFDVQVITGTNTSGQTKGLDNWSPLTRAYTDASPTVPEALAKAWGAYLDVAGSSGYGTANLDEFVTIMHPRRLAWFYGAGQTPEILEPLFPGGRAVPSGGIPTTIGAGTNEDEIYVLVRSMVRLFADPPVFVVYPQVGSGNLITRFQARQPMAVLVKQPTALCQIRGTGFAGATL